MLFDRRAWRRHRDRAAGQGCVEFLHREAADRLIGRLDDVKREEIGVGGDPACAELREEAEGRVGSDDPFDPRSEAECAR